MDFNARDIAVLALRDRAHNVSANLNRLLDAGALSCADRALAFELALGVMRRRGTLEAVRKAFSRQPDKHLPGSLNEVIQVGLYQILFLDRVPDFATVNEAVDQAGRFHHKRQGNYVNGVLRTVARNVTEVHSGEPPLRPDVIPAPPEGYKKSSSPVFADPREDEVGYVAEAFSLPEVLARRWIQRFGDLRRTADIAAHACCRPPLILRVNRLTSSVEEVIRALDSEGIPARKHANGDSVVLDAGVGFSRINKLPLFTGGQVQPQDPTATGVCLAAEVEAGMNVLDFCAAPGTKTTHLAELMGNTGSITAMDIPDKLHHVRDNCRRMGIDIVTTHPAEGAGELPAEGFDRVIVDAPCSNTGVLARRPEARWRFTQARLGRMVNDQKFLLKVAAGFVKPGGMLVYSTCSIEPEENHRVAEWLKQQQPRLEPVRREQVLPVGAGDPTQWRDGGFIAVFRSK